VRFLTLTLVVAALGVGGAALAEPELVVDPWGRANAEVDSWFGPVVTERAGNPRTEDLLVDPWVPAREPERAPPEPRAKRVEVFPIAPANAPLANTESIINPWAPAVASEIPSLAKWPEPRVAERAATPWSGRMVEIVDPWGRTRDYSPIDRIRIVIDPWAR
jgi:hypothetical protein